LISGFKKQGAGHHGRMGITTVYCLQRVQYAPRICRFRQWRMLALNHRTYLKRNRLVVLADEPAGFPNARLCEACQTALAEQMGDG
jgi:hypothetical protein